MLGIPKKTGSNPVFCVLLAQLLTTIINVLAENTLTVSGSSCLSQVSVWLLETPLGYSMWIKVFSFGSLNIKNVANYLIGWFKQMKKTLKRIETWG